MMTERRFDFFVIFAEMRTGSNFLEDSLNALPDVNCYGEIFNPTFIGSQEQTDLMGFDLRRRERDPIGLIECIVKDADALPGFRIFHDHDERVVEYVLSNPRAAKIILTRSHLQSYVSDRIATEADQWILTDVRDRRLPKVRFDPQVFARRTTALTQFQTRLRKGLQKHGQPVFLLRYEDVTDLNAVNGLAAFLGSKHRISQLSQRLKKQNPTDLREKVSNYAELAETFAREDLAQLESAERFEARMAPRTDAFVLHPKEKLLYVPIKGTPVDGVLDWLSKLRNVRRRTLVEDTTPDSVRQWMAQNPGFRSFAILRHPVERAFAAFNTFMLSNHVPAGYPRVRRRLRAFGYLDVPEDGLGEDIDVATHKVLFLRYLEFVKLNLGGSTSMSPDASWNTQSALLRNASSVALIHRLIPEHRAENMVLSVAREARVKTPPPLELGALPGPHSLDEIYDDKIEAAVQAAYHDDYVQFGFSMWQTDRRRG